MTLTLKAALLAAVLEGVLAIATFTSSYGPCGPGTLLGQFGLMTHVIPLLVVGSIFTPLHDKPIDTPIFVVTAIAFQYLFWLVILRLALFRRTARQSNEA